MFEEWYEVRVLIAGARKWRTLADHLPESMGLARLAEVRQQIEKGEVYSHARLVKVTEEEIENA